MTSRAESKVTQYLYLTTTGRRSGQPREIEIWFTRRGDRYCLGAEHRERAERARAVKKLSEQKYGWGTGLVVELDPAR